MAATELTPASALAGKAVSEFRVYDASNARADGVQEHYRQMRLNQSLKFSRAQVAQWRASWGSRPGGRMTVKEALLKCDTFVDRSDPDTSLPNSLHMLQAAEASRLAGKPDWMVLCALVHDVGKLMYLWGSCADGQGGKADDPQWSLGGDTWVVGAPLPSVMVHPHLNELNVDAHDPVINASPTGIYSPKCGLMNCEFAFGHDEYAYMWALHNKVDIPREGLAILRLHSLYPWHTGGAYSELEAPEDEALKAAVREFNVFDLYTKSSSVPVLEEVWPHYQAIIDRLCPGVLDW